MNRRTTNAIHENPYIRCAYLRRIWQLTTCPLSETRRRCWKRLTGCKILDRLGRT